MRCGCVSPTPTRPALQPFTPGFPAGFAEELPDDAAAVTFPESREPRHPFCNGVAILATAKRKNVGFGSVIALAQVGAFCKQTIYRPSCMKRTIKPCRSAPTLARSLR